MPALGSNLEAAISTPPPPFYTLRCGIQDLVYFPPPDLCSMRESPAEGSFATLDAQTPNNIALRRKHSGGAGLAWNQDCCNGMQDVNQLAYEAAMCQATQRYVTKRTRGELSVSVLLPADTFLEVVILNFLSVVLGKDLVRC